MNKPHITVAVGYLIAMDANGTLFVFHDDSKFYPLFGSSPEVWKDTPYISINPLVRRPRPHYFDGSECVTAECLPPWGVDAYYAKELPKSLQESSGK